jgi:undecaprenyl-diphosphatase
MNMQSLILFDQQLSAQFSTFIASHPFLASTAVVIGVGAVYLIPLLLIYAWFSLSRKSAIKAFLAGLLAWEGLSKLIAQLVDRARPSMSQIGTKELVFHRPDTSFPSDHSAFLAAVTLSFYLSGHKKMALVTGIIAVLVGIARVGIGVHFPADIIAGWIVGCVVVFLLHLIDQPLEKYLIDPIIRLARKIHL